jgi:serine/threonine protein kinase
MESQILGSRYEVQQQLSKKAGRQTLLARNLETKKLVVIKLLTFGSDFEWDDLKLFEREAETLKALSHPAIPQYLDYLELDGKNGKEFAIVQTYIKAKSLEQHLKAGRTFSEAEIKKIATAVLEILTYLQGRMPQVIHRDIKPSNILLANRSGHTVGQVYLVDFGSVKNLAAQEGGTITVVGTYGYMPPEQFGGRAVPASDIYSLGATLIYLATGSHPADLPQRDLKIQFEPAAKISKELILWLKWMTEPSLERRLATAKDALSALGKPEQGQLKNFDRTVIRRPGSREILLTKSADYLEIIVPGSAHKKPIKPITNFYKVPPIKYVFIQLIFTFTYFYILAMAVKLHSRPLWFLSVGLFLIDLAIQWLEPLVESKLRLTIIGPQITIESSELRRVKGKKVKTFKAPIHHINKLELVYQNLARSPHQLIIWTGKRKCWRLNHLTAVELDLVASELSQQLGLPIDTKKLPAG